MIKKDDGTLEIEQKDLTEDNDDVRTEDVTEETLKQDLLTTIAKKKAWRTKAIDSESGKSFKDLYEESVKKQAPDTIIEKKKEIPESEALRKDVSYLKEEAQKRIFQHANKLTPEQVNEVFAYAKGSGLEPKDALEKAFMKKVLTQMKTDDDNAKASLPPSRRSPIQTGGKSFKDMTVEERRKTFSK